MVAKEKLDVFHSHAKQIFSEALEYQSENEEVVSEMASVNTGELNNRIQLLQENTTLVTSLLGQSYISEHDFEERRVEVQKVIQSNTSLLEDPSENLWSIYRTLLLVHVLKFLSLHPLLTTKKPLGTCISPRIKEKTNQAKNVYLYT